MSSADQDLITAAYADLAHPAAPAEEPVAAVRRRMRRRARRKRGVAAVLATCVVAVVTVAGVQGLNPSPGANGGAAGGGTAAPTGAVPDSGNASCAFDYNRQTLKDQDWAADATVTHIGRGRTTVTVRLDVHTWYRGGSGESLAVRLPSPRSEVEDAPPAYAVGSRLLISGARDGGLIAWTCGFTRYYDEQTAAVWATVFAR